MTQAEALWQDLLATAIVGVERRPPSLPPAGGELGALLAGLAALDPERLTLAAAGALALYRDAGKPAGRAAPAAFPPVASDERPRCRPAAVRRLLQLLGGEHDGRLPQWPAAAGTAEPSKHRRLVDEDLLAEWLNAAAAAGLRVPEPYLPALLDRGAHLVKLRPAIEAVAGERGRWLAAQNAAWSYLAQPDPDETWRSGGRAERRDVFAALRGRDPDRARTLLAATWARESADDRERFVTAFGAGLSLADEAFLEAALDDRAAGVRHASAGLLTTLSGSRLSDRVFARASACLRYVKDRSSFSYIQVTLPEEPDPAARRDEIAHVVRIGVGERTAFLQRLLERTPPRRWCELWQVTPAELLEAAGRTEAEWRAVLLEGWRIATYTFADPDWAEALADVDDEQMEVLWRIDPARGRSRLLRRLASIEGADRAEFGLLGVVARSDHPFDVELSRAIIDAIRAYAGRANVPSAGWSSWLAARLGKVVHTALADEAATGWPEDAPRWPAWKPVIEQFIAALAFRREMLTELGADGA